ncbi:MAG: hypothetical protein JWO06_3780 [Bacteroidota bacterium]|nr:hypothetical protein [Bacteroidota bacterium]
MKQGKLIFLLCSFMLMLGGCTDKSSALVKTWKLQDMKYTRDIPKDMQPVIEKKISEMRNAFSLTYNPDGTYTTQMGNEALKGKWKLNWNSTKLTSTAESGDEKDYSIIELNDNKYSFAVIEGSDKVIFTMVPAK